MIRRHLFDDNMEVKEVNKAGQRFDKVSRIEARGSDHGDVKLVLDYNSQIYNLPEGTKFNLVISNSLEIESDDLGRNEYDQTNRASLADDFEYVMYGKIFRMATSKNDQVEVYASFGGLLMMLEGEPQTFSSFKIDDRIYLLIKRIGLIDTNV